MLTGAWADDRSPGGPGTATLAAYRDQVFVPTVEAHGGRTVDRSPALLTATFARAEEAVTCAMEIRERTDAGSAGPEGRLPPIRWSVALEGEATVASFGKPSEVTLSPAVAALADSARRVRSVGPAGDGTYPASGPTVLGTPRVATAVPPHRPDCPPGMGLRPGDLLNGTYEIEEKLASGGMGEVFRGREIHSGGAVAIKVIRLDMADHPSALSLFQKEALVLRGISHDTIVRYYSFSFDPGLGRHYLVMEFVDGPSLARVVEDGPMPVDRVALLCRRVASGLQVAHERGIVHRDLSPDNVILPGGDVGRAKIIDFGIARAAAIGGGTIINGGFAGKNSYVSPEHLGLAGGEVTAESDIYSLGLVLAEACLGHPLDMAGTQVEVIDKRRRVPDLSGVDPRLRDLIARMLDPDPTRRPATMEAVAAADLPSPPPRRPDPPAERAAATSQRVVPPKPARGAERWIIRGAIALALVGGVGAVAYTSLSGGEPPRPTMPAAQHVLASPQASSMQASSGAPPPSPSPPAGAEAPAAVVQQSPAPPPDQQAVALGTTVARPTPPSSTEAPGGAPASSVSPPSRVEVPATLGGVQRPPAAPGPQTAAPGTAASRPTAPASTQAPGGAPAPSASPASRVEAPATSGAVQRPPAAAPGPQTAALGEPASRPTTPSSPSSPMADYVTAYEGGACFFLRPVRLTSTPPALDAFGASRDAFDRLDKSFQDRFGVSPDIAGNRVRSRQCPAVEFLKRTAAQTTPPTLFIGSARLRKGQTLAGEVRDLLGRSVRLLLVGENGTVRDVTSALKRDGDAMVFELTAAPDASTGAPEILVAVASSEPLPPPTDGGVSDAGTVFDDLLGMAARRNMPLGADAKLFIVGS